MFVAKTIALQCTDVGIAIKIFGSDLYEPPLCRILDLPLMRI